MIRIDDEKGKKGSSSSILFLLGKTMRKSDAWNKKMGAHASTPKMELMHETEKQGSMHHFSSESGPAESQSRPGGAPKPARRSPKPGPAESQSQPGGAPNPVRRSPKASPAEPQTRSGGVPNPARRPPRFAYDSPETQ